MEKIRVAINGYGVIGKRVADAVALQPDMTVAGICDTATDYRIHVGIERGFSFYAANSSAAEEAERSSIATHGSLDDLLSRCDVVADCTPKHIGALNLERYRAVGVKAVLQGGEKHSATGHSFVAQVNYETAIGRDCTRVVSCNTTSVVRTLGALRGAGMLVKARGVLIRRATDPWESDHSGIMNTVVPEPSIPSHQGPDAQTILPNLDVVTIAAVAAHTQSHCHFWVVDLGREVSRDEILEAFMNAPRIATIRMSDGIHAPNNTQELMRDLGRPRGDMWEVALWEDQLHVQGTEAYYTYMVDNQAIVIPETIDAIRALIGKETSAAASIRLTDETLGIRKAFI